MNSLITINRRWISLAVTLAIFVAGTATGATWQCPDGKPCDANCKMLHIAASAVHAQVANEPLCSHCPPASTHCLTMSGVESSGCSCTTPHCVLRVSEKPSSSLQEGPKLLAPLSALIPNIITVPQTEAASAPAPSAEFQFNPKRFLRPHSGRAPPTVH